MAAFARSYAAFTQAMYRAADGLGQDLNQLGPKPGSTDRVG